MSRNEFRLLHLLAEKIGIRTAAQLEEFKQKTKATSANSSSKSISSIAELIS